MIAGVTAFAVGGEAGRTDLISDENGTRYSVDGGETWTTESPAVPLDSDAYESLEVIDYTETITEGSEITQEDKANAVFAGDFTFDVDTDEITVDILYEGEGPELTEEDKANAIFIGDFVFDGDTENINVDMTTGVPVITVG
jgi:hypothetical protein